MANVNKVMLIGRLTRDPEAIPGRAGGNAGAKFGFAVDNSKFNQDTKQWDKVPVFIDMEIWNREMSKQADRVLETLRKGQQVFIEGHLKMDQWEDKNGGGKRSKLLVVVENFQYLEPRQDGQGGQGEYAPRASARPAMTQARPTMNATRSNGSHTGYEDQEPGMGAPPARGGGVQGNDDDIPF